VLARPELLGLLGLTAALNLWNLGVNGWANTYYSAAVRSMSTSWRDFLFASLDKSGLMTVDKPPLALWVQALSVRVFGYHPLSMLVPEALMGVAAVGLLYDLVARRFGRVAGLVGGLAFAVTPITVAVARHNNPDELLILCSVAAVWSAVRAIDTGRTRWLVLSGVLVGLGFETKMGIALLIVPGIAAGWLWAARGSLWRRLRALLAAGTALVVVGGAWPLLVTLTPAADRPWISGTSDNSIWSLVFGYNGLGRVTGQTGAAGGGGGGVSGGSVGLFRLLQTGLGDQAGWLLGFTLVAGVALVLLTRLRRRDPRTGWLIAVGGAFAVSALVFSFASGIFHPYYVSFLAPFAAALVGAGAGLMLPESVGGAGQGRSARVIAPLAIAGGVVTELVVLGETSGALSWAIPVVLLVGGACALALADSLAPRLQAVAVAVALAALLAAPATWAAETLGHAASSTFPTGGPASASFGGPVGGRGGFGGGPGGFVGGRGGFPFGSRAGGGGLPGTLGGSSPRRGGGLGGSASSGFGGGFSGDTTSLKAAVRYVEAHGGGTIGVESQSSAAELILSSNANVAGLGGFSGRESSVSARWIAMEVRSGKLSWLLFSGTQDGGFRGDTRSGSEAAFKVVERVARKVIFTTSSGTTVTLYHLTGSANAILRAAGAQTGAR
jgi:4-amino-4-deoxy-L-arabinose transferase-like glycosyltransferase